MLGLGSNLTKGGAGAKTIVTDSLVLKHNYSAGAVQPLSDGAASFVASGDDAISMGDQDNLSFGTGSFSTSCWVNVNAKGATQFILSKKADASYSGNGYALALGNTGTDWTFGVSDGSTVLYPATAVEPNANQWYHLCGTFNTTTNVATLYVDGVLTSTSTGSVGDVDTAQPFQIGRAGTSTTTDFDGYICNVGVWSAALSQAQVKSIMNKNYAGLTASEKTDLVSWWNLDSVIPDTTTLVYDNHHGGGEILGSELVTGASSATTVSGSYTDVLTNYNGTTGQTLAVTFTLGGDYRLKLWSWSNYTVIDDSIEYNTGTHTAYIRITGNNFGGGDLRFNNLQTSTVGGSISNISVKLINGNTGTLS